MSHRSFRLSPHRRWQWWLLLIPVLGFGGCWAYFESYRLGAHHAVARAVSLTAAGDSSRRVIVHLALDHPEEARRDFANSYSIEGADQLFMSYYADIRFPSGRVYHVDANRRQWLTWDVWLSDAGPQ